MILFLTAAEVCRATTLSEWTLRRQVRAGCFPAPLRLSPGRVGWRLEDLEAWAEGHCDPCVTPSHQDEEPNP